MELPLLKLPVRFTPTKDVLSVLNERQWICSYSGGKDSTALVTWIEWLRRVGLVKCETPRLVQSDTGVEFPFLHSLSQEMMAALSRHGWKCEVVKPKISERLYCRIFGIGNTPIHPGGRKMRWCTRSTKIDPMERFSKSLGPDVVHLSGVRWGESANRDNKLALNGCAAGGECGLPNPSDRVFGPIIAWTTCKVVEWLNGEAEIGGAIDDLLPMTRRLIEVYDVKMEKQVGFWEQPLKVSASRFGCIGCPAITREKITDSKQGKQHPEWQHLKRIYEIWDSLYNYDNRCWKMKDSGPQRGPLKIETRKKYFAMLMEIQRLSGVVLVTPEELPARLVRGGRTAASGRADDVPDRCRMSIVRPRPLMPKVEPVDDPKFRREWAAAHPYCMACGVPIEYAPWPGLETHHIIRFRRSDEVCNLFRSCQLCHSRFHGAVNKVELVVLGPITLGQQLMLKKLRDPEAWNPERLAVLFGRALPELEPVPEDLDKQWLKWRPVG